MLHTFLAPALPLASLLATPDFDAGFPHKLPSAASPAEPDAAAPATSLQAAESIGARQRDQSQSRSAVAPASGKVAPHGRDDDSAGARVKLVKPAALRPSLSTGGTSQERLQRSAMANRSSAAAVRHAALPVLPKWGRTYLSIYV